MIICIDIGNTSVGFGFYKQNELVKTASIYPEDFTNDFSYANYLNNLLNELKVNKNSIENILYSSVVPNVDNELIPILKEIFNLEPIRIKSLPIDIRIDGIDVSEVGDDLICDLIGAKKLFNYPTIVIDLGTASKILLIDKEGKFDSCLIIPGLSMSIASLSSKAALLPTIDLKAPESILAHNTVDAMNAGIILGHAEMIMGLCHRLEKEIGYKCHKVLTGGSAKFLLKELGEEYHYEHDLAFIGMMKMYEGR